MKAVVLDQFILIYNLFNDAVNSLDYTASYIQQIQTNELVRMWSQNNMAR
jgi:hypothetical protein